MNRQKRTTGIQRMFDGIYMEAMRRGGFVTFVVMAIISAGLGYLIYGYLLKGWVESGREYQRQVAAKELENRKTEAMLEG
ncbi:MAG: hypothetical protein KA956_13680, partial [Pyrinomonadaceae bacterium]|nr:hypothetical protein [Pyrinomonadaceae bacterium]